MTDGKISWTHFLRDIAPSLPYYQNFHVVLILYAHVALTNLRSEKENGWKRTIWCSSKRSWLGIWSKESETAKHPRKHRWQEWDRTFLCCNMTSFLQPAQRSYHQFIAFFLHSVFFLHSTVALAFFQEFFSKTSSCCFKNIFSKNFSSRFFKYLFGNFFLFQNFFLDCR